MSKIGLLAITMMISGVSYADSSVSNVDFEYISNQGDNHIATCTYRTSERVDGILKINKPNSFKLYSKANQSVASAKFSFMNIKGSVFAIVNSKTGNNHISDISLNVYDTENPYKVLASTSSNGHFNTKELQQKSSAYISSGIFDAAAVEVNCVTVKK